MLGVEARRQVTRGRGIAGGRQGGRRTSHPRYVKGLGGQRDKVGTVRRQRVCAGGGGNEQTQVAAGLVTARSLVMSEQASTAARGARGALRAGEQGEQT